MLTERVISNIPLNLRGKFEKTARHINTSLTLCREKIIENKFISSFVSLSECHNIDECRCNGIYPRKITLYPHTTT